MSMREREQGVCVLGVLVDQDGSIVRTEIRKSSGFPRLDAAAQEALKRARLAPLSGLDGGRQAWIEVPVTFKIEAGDPQPAR
jgi:periplasmic protein TonB